MAVTLQAQSVQLDSLEQTVGEGQCWTADFYHYRNVYVLDTDDSGICYEHQLASSCPIDLEKHHIAPDSMLLMRTLPFTYSYTENVLTIVLASSGEEIIGDRSFERIIQTAGGVQLRSTYAYAYGREVLLPDSVGCTCCR